jgi:O-antigen/teichoic acid export membrane protein
MTAVAALIRGKLAAVLLGTTGVGIFGQVDSFYRSLVQICVLSTGVGVTRCVAELQAKGEDAGIRRAFWSTTLFSLTLAGVVALAVVLLSRSLSLVVLGDQKYAFFLSIVALGFPLQALSDIMLGMLAGLRDLRAQVGVTAAFTGGGTILYALLILRYGLAGAIYGIFAIAACMCLAAVFFLRRNRSRKLIPHAGERVLDGVLLRFILTIGLTGGVMAVSDRVVLLICRSVLIRHFGLEANGLYQAVFSFSQLSISVTFGFVSTYLLPTLSGLRDSERVRSEFKSALRLILLISTIFSVAMILYGNVVIRTAYSDEFLKAAPLLRVQALGDFIRTLVFVLSTTLFALHGWKPWFAIGMTSYIGYVVLFLILLPILGLSAITTAYLATQGVACSLAIPLFVHYTRINALTAQGPLLARSIALLLIETFLALTQNAEVTYIIGSAALLIWAAFAFSTSEYRRLRDYMLSPAALFGSSEW